jgi:Acyclic terpene utilisation family protein AtuA
MKNKIKIASGQGFWGDLINAPYVQVTKGDIDYLIMDYLAEVTMSILQIQKNKNPELGYAKDVITMLKEILQICKNKGIKVITNAGGVNPIACAKAILNMARELEIKKLKVGIVLGDDISSQIDWIISQGCHLDNMETGDSIVKIKDKITSANAYLGAFPLVEALESGADIIIAGRTSDVALALAPMIYEFGWKTTDYNLLAAGTVAGHILECGTQASGGNFLGDWQSINNFAEIGFPIAEVNPEGEIIIFKHSNTGGKISFETVAEQLVYEIGDPKEYITPDCIVDFTSIKLEDLGNNRVRIFDVKGEEKTKFYKVSCSYSFGYAASGTLTYTWPQALTKAKIAGQILKKRLENLNLHFDEIRTEFLGYNACHESLAKEINEDDINEVVLKVSVRAKDRDAVERFGKEVAPLVLNGPPSVTGYVGSRPKPREVFAYWPALIPKSLVKPTTQIFEV